MKWPALESDPDIFTSYFRSIGLAEDWQFTELFSLDEDVPGAALVLAYRSRDQGPIFSGAPAEVPFYLKQTNELNNACGLIAGLHAIFNSEAGVLEGSLLHTIKEAVTGKTPQECAE